MLAIDFETHGIERRPNYPPEPIGVGLRDSALRDQKARYFVLKKLRHYPETALNWEPRAGLGFLEYLYTAWRHHDSLLFHEARFDLAVAEKWLGLPWPKPERIEDTKVASFLADPYSRLHLKEAAPRYAGCAVDEKDELHAWIAANVKVDGKKVKKSEIGAHIDKAPLPLVSEYCCADVSPLTWELYRALLPIIQDQQRAYRREIAVLEPVYRMSQRGIPLDLAGLADYRRRLVRRVASYDRRLRQLLGVGAEFDLGQKGPLADALEAAGFVKPEDWSRTPKTGARQVGGDELEAAGCDARFLDVWRLRGSAKFEVATFCDAWLEHSVDGRFYTDWKTFGAEDGGAKTARLSSSPNMQNISKDGELRRYVRAPRGRTFVCGDISQQEPRITAHFAGGALAQAYRHNPRLDLHRHVAELLNVERDPTGKQLNLAVIYALGILALSKKLGCEIERARGLRDQHRAELPEVAALDRAWKEHWARGGYIETWGGAKVACPPAAVIDGRLRTFEYRALNNVVQRTAAEQLKEVLIQLPPALPNGAGLVATAHDEVLVECDRGEQAKKCKKLVREALEGVPGFDVPFIAEVGEGKTWATAKP